MQEVDVRADRRDVVVGVFTDQGQAREAIGALKDAGFSGDDISLLMPDGGQPRDAATATENEAGKGAATGAVAGGVLGGLGGFLVGMGALAIPVLGPFIAAGAFATALAGAAIGAGVGAVAGALVGMGIPQEEAEWYEGEVRGGRTLLTVRTGGRYDEAQTLLRRYGAYDIQSRDQVGMTAATTEYSAATTERPATYGTSGGAAGRWEDERLRYRSNWEQRYGGSGGRWEDDEPSYRYGWERANDPRYQGRSWAEVEPEVRRDWERGHPDTPWERAGEAIRDAWERRPGH
jgi:hypothetical protein